MCLYAGDLRIDEGRKLQSIVRRGRDRVKMRRARVIPGSNQWTTVPDIARRQYFSEQHVRNIIKAFNEDDGDVT